MVQPNYAIPDLGGHLVTFTVSMDPLVAGTSVAIKGVDKALISNSGISVTKCGFEAGISCGEITRLPSPLNVYSSSFLTWPVVVGI
jgi:hypothetical protein